MKMAWLSSRGRWGAASAAVFAALFLGLSGTASAGINDTRHNLGSGTGPAGRNQVTDTAEVCVFCHTPHGGSTSAPVPLWNKRLGANGTPAGGGTYTTYASLQTPSLDGAVAAVGGISLACLSCHDGTQAMDNIINAPGSGGLSTDGGLNGGLGYTWASPGGTVNAAGALTGGAALIGTDLSNDHPIGIQYCGGGLGATGAITTCADQDFNPASTATINGNAVFWIDTGAAGTKQRTDLPLYVRPGETVATGPLVECGSCHDPHVSTGQAGPAGTGRVAGETFLRISNANSAVCTACHVK
jgi:cytochrome c553